MKKIFLLLLVFPCLISAQYFPFKYNDLYGVVDKDGNEEVKPMFTYVRTEIKDVAVFTLEGKYIYYNLIDGTQKEFDDFDMNEVYIKDEYFSLITKNKKQFLLGQISAKVIPLKSIYTGFKNIGPNYILAKQVDGSDKLEKEDSEEESLSEIKMVRLTKQKRINYFVFEHSVQLNFIAKLNKEPIDDENDITVTTYKIEDTEPIIKNHEFNNATINRWDHFKQEDFSILAFQNKQIVTLFNAKLKPFKIFTYTGDRREIESKVAEMSKEKIIDATYPKSVMMIKEQDPDYKAPVVISSSNSIYTLSYLKDGEYIAFLKTPSEISIWDKEKLSFIDTEGNKIVVTVDYKEQKIYIPTSFLKQFEITLLELEN